MPQITAQEDVKDKRTGREVPTGYAWRTDFMQPPAGNKADPHAFLAERTPQGVIRPHYHDVDQFQVIIGGGGTLGKHPLAIHAVHFARAHTPYGPIKAGGEGVQFLTLRPRRAGGIWFVPETREELKRIPNRKPWQLTEQPNFESSGESAVHAFSNIKDDHGLAAFSLSLKPNVKISAPDPRRSSGQYFIVTKGSLMYEGKAHKAITIIFVRPDEQPFQLAAGADGLEALVLNFPRQSTDPEPVKARDTEKSTEFRVWQCLLCAFTYDEAKGLPDEGIAPGTRWEDVPDDWICPDCSTSKSDFDMAIVA